MNTVGSGVEFGAIGAAINGATAPMSGPVTMGTLPPVNMAGSLYTSSFASDVVGQTPAGWTPTGVTSNVTWSVFDLGGTSVLRSIGTGANALRLLDYAPMSDNTTDQEMLLQVRPGSSNNAHSVGAALRISGAAGNTFYGFALSGQTLDFARWVNGGRTWIGSGTPIVYDTNTFYWIRARVSGSTVMAKTWRADEPEPGSWFRTATDATIASGSAGILHWQSDVVDIAQSVIWNN
jgi:hypothetical protein